jgi:butyryl-CoA:acetate CoA-transferase
MDLLKEYQRKRVSPGDAVKRVKSGDWVDYGQFAAQAVVLDQALAKRKDELWDVKIRSSTRAMNIPEVVRVDPAAEHFIYNSHFLSRHDRQAHDQGLCWYIPIFYHENPLCYRNFLNVDVAMLAAAPMDKQGFFNFSVSLSYSRAICDKAKIVILEVNPNLPTCLGGRDEKIHISEVDFIVEATWPVPEIHPAPPTEGDKKIAEFLLKEIEDGACLQLGIGGLPNAVGALIAKSDLKDLGIHSEMFNDAMVDLVESGQVTGARKNIDPYKIVYTFSLGTRRTYDFLHQNKICAAYPVDYTNDPFVIAQNDKVVAINNCVVMDLFGQVCSESYGPRQISGTGGQADFMFGANRSKGGKGFVCMSSAREDKKGDAHSRVVPVLPPGSIVTDSRNLVSYVVTEYGIVNLRGKSTWERAADIISIAHPDFREGLIKEAEKLKIWRRSNKMSL